MELPDIRDLLPHSGPMVLLDQVVAADDESLCAEVRVREDSLFYADGAVGGWVGLEYMAQAIGAYAGYRARLRGEPVRIGYLLGTRHYECKQPSFALGSVLKIYVKRVLQSDDGLASFDCHIEDEKGRIASANVTVFQSADGRRLIARLVDMSDSVLVTGSSRGIGKAIALRLARDGFDIVVHCQSRRAEADEVAEAITAMGRQARVLQFDIAARTAVAAALEADIAQHGCYYGVVCNAGVIRDNAFPAMSGEDWDIVLKTNLDGFYNVLNPLIMPLVRRRAPGRIVTLSSVAGLIGNRGQVNYSAAKAGIIGATKALALELAKREITVNCVAPGLIETDMSAEVPLDEALKLIPARRLGRPEEVAALVSFLFSADAGYITRQVISVNGGLA